MIDPEILLRFHLCVIENKCEVFKGESSKKIANWRDITIEKWGQKYKLCIFNKNTYYWKFYIKNQITSIIR